MPRTYFPDDAGFTLTELQDGLSLKGNPEPITGIRNSIEVHLRADKHEVKLFHTLTNDGHRTVELAPWSITQLRLGDVIIAPMIVGNSDSHGLLPNLQFSIWPYMRIHDLTTADF